MIKVVNGEQVEMTPEQEAEFLAEYNSRDHEAPVREALIRVEREKALEALIDAQVAPKMAQINGMDRAALVAALRSGGLPG